jgi:hypothetical protein
VLRLTLFFFGAAEDIPEAAKMVTAGTARLHFCFQNCKPMAKCERRPQALLRPLTKCTTREITTTINRV